MATTIFERNICDLNFSFLSESGEGGVLLTQAYESLTRDIATPNILFALEKARKFEADAVYFRYFQDGRAATPQLYFFDYTNKPLSTEDKNQIHVRMWNGYQVPAYIIIEQSAISIFDSREKPDEDKSSYAHEIISLTGDAIKAFNAKGFDDGLFWEEQNKKNFKFEQSATKDLIRGLKSVYKSFQEQSNLDKHVALKLLVQSLLIKYLEERDEDSASGYFAGTYFKRNFQCTNFCDTIRNGKLLDLLDKLASDFNGKIFEWNKKTEQAERAAIQNTEVNQLADYLDGNIRDSQYVLWRLYSFSHLPVEVISSVYEELLTDSKDIVYTPEMIVSTLVDECMPLKEPQQNFKLIDVSCGSGIFLVKAYKRIVQWWRYEQWLETGTLSKPSLAVLKELLLKSIHGVDIQQDAIRLSIFSLALAVLDEVNLDPPTWGKLKFPDLSENIITKDFFEFITNNPVQDFDLVIGNPPFNPPQTEDGKTQTKNGYLKAVEKKFGYKSEIPIPTQNIALHFFFQSFKLLKTGGLLCLIQPSGPLLYQDEQEFKNTVFSKVNLLQVIDFSKLSEKIWENANVATAAIFVQNILPNDEPILHLIAERTFSNTNKLFLEFDYYNFHFIHKVDLLSNSFIWKTNLLGGGRLFDLIQRLEQLPKLIDYLKEKRRNYQWAFGVGFVVGNKELKADYITGKQYIEVIDLEEKGLVKKPRPCLIDGFYTPRKKDIYQAPHILIRGIIGDSKIPVYFSREYLAFPKGIIGIYAPEREHSELQKLYEYLNQHSEVLRAFIMSTSGRVLVDKATALNMEDVLDVPYIEIPLAISEAEQLIITDIQKYYSKIKNEYWLEPTTVDFIKQFTDVFCKTLNSVYQIGNKQFQPYKILDTGNYFAVHFEYREEIITLIEEQILNLEQYIQESIPQIYNNQQHVHIQKIMKVYGRDSIILVKPKQLRYWLPSIALRDADESFADYVKIRYPNA